jgi:hypothetical protein
VGSEFFGVEFSTILHKKKFWKKKKKKKPWIENIVHNHIYANMCKIKRKKCEKNVNMGTSEYNI